MPYGFLCCGPSTVYNVIDTSDEESDGEAEVQGVRLAPVISTPEEVDGLRNGSGQLKRRSSRGSGSSEEPSFMDRVNSGLQVRALWVRKHTHKGVELFFFSTRTVLCPSATRPSVVRKSFLFKF